MNKKLNKRIRLVGLIVILLISTVVYLGISDVNNSVKDVLTYSMNVNVGEYVGLNVQTDKIYFGTVPKGGFAYRQFSIYVEDDSYVVIKGEKPLSDIVYFDWKPKFLEAGSNVSILIYVIPNNELDYGEYESDLYVYVMKRNSFFAEWILPGNHISLRKELPTGGGKVGLEIVNTTKNETSA